MPHQVVEYSANLEGAIDIRDLVDCLHEAALRKAAARGAENFRFFGMKASGIGRDGSDYSFDFYMENKNVCVALDTHRVPVLGGA